MKLAAIAGLGLAGSLFCAAPALAATASQSTAPTATTTMRQVQHPASVHRVAILQESLNSEGAHLKVDGIWGPATERALRHYQRRNSLQVTGQLDQATRASLAPIG
jgi:peptidoglycan hydrolase-like protein with peptidoglycan-binding domain